MTDQIRAPWTPKQVAALSAFQRHGSMHPFTCGALHTSGQSPVLEATNLGWTCPDPACEYTQDWAHAFMTDQPTPETDTTLAVAPPRRRKLRHVQPCNCEHPDCADCQRRATERERATYYEAHKDELGEQGARTPTTARTPLVCSDEHHAAKVAALEAELRRVRNTNQKLAAEHTATPAAPPEHCGHLSPEMLLSSPRTECVLRPGHQGSHADDRGCRWWPVPEQPPQPAPDGLREQYATAIESEIYEYRERTMLWEETGGVTEEITRLATRGTMSVRDQETEQLRLQLSAAALAADTLKYRADQAEQRRDQLAATLREVLAMLLPVRNDHGTVIGYEPPYPTTPANVNRWRNVLNQSQEPAGHVYLSTGCLHGDHAYCQAMTGANGAKRPAECKHCGAPCICPCHTTHTQEPTP